MQDSNEDWQAESAAMGQVYQNSICNIAATGARNSHSGCFVTRNPALVRPCLVDPSRQSGELPFLDGCSWFALLDSDFWKRNVTGSPLGRRGWAIQERMLAPRIIHWGEEQVLWECLEHTACESFVEGMYNNRIPTIISRQLDLYKQTSPWPLDSRSTQGYELWRQTIEQYMACDLTKESDKLVAVSGLAKVIKGQLQDDYLAGLWRDSLPKQLLWKVHNCKQANGTASRRPCEYRAPSWSWGSVDATVFLRDDVWGNKFNDRVKVEVLDAQVERVTSDETGPVVGGFVRLSGPLSPCKVIRPYESLNWLFKVRRSDDKYDSSSRVELDVPMDISDSFILALFYASRGSFYEGLVLRKHDSESGTYLRCGTFWIKERFLSAVSLKDLDYDPHTQIFQAWENPQLHKDLYQDPKELTYVIY